MEILPLAERGEHAGEARDRHRELRNVREFVGFVHRSTRGEEARPRLAELAGRLERAARGEGAEALAAGLDELRREADAVLREARRLGAGA